VAGDDIGNRIDGGVRQNLYVFGNLAVLLAVFVMMHAEDHPVGHVSQISARLSSMSVWSGELAWPKPLKGESMKKARTLYDKIWDDHLVHVNEHGAGLLYIDRHLVHEVTSRQAFAWRDGRSVVPKRTLAVFDHNVPTTADRYEGIKNEESRIEVDALAQNAWDPVRTPSARSDLAVNDVDHKLTEGQKSLGSGTVVRPDQIERPDGARVSNRPPM
jgi:hypothetical protein